MGAYDKDINLLLVQKIEEIKLQEAGKSQVFDL
jgi:hypothetical protein